MDARQWGGESTEAKRGSKLPAQPTFEAQATAPGEPARPDVGAGVPAPMRGRRPSPDREFGQHHRTVGVAVDVLMLLAATGVVALLSPTSSPTGQVPREPLFWSLALSAAILVTFGLRGMYGPRLRIDLLDEVLKVVTGVAVA